MDTSHEDVTAPPINTPTISPINFEDYMNILGDLEEYSDEQRLAIVEPINTSTSEHSEFGEKNQYTSTETVQVNYQSRKTKKNPSSTKTSKSRSRTGRKSSKQPKSTSTCEMSLATTSNSDSLRSITHNARQNIQNNFPSSSKPLPPFHTFSDIINMPPLRHCYAHLSRPVSNDKYQLLPILDSIPVPQASQNYYQNYQQDTSSTIPPAKRFKSGSGSKNLVHTITTNAMNNLPTQSTAGIKLVEPPSNNYPYNFQTTSTITKPPPSYEYATASENSHMRCQLPSVQFKPTFPESADTTLQRLRKLAPATVAALLGPPSAHHQKFYPSMDYSQSSVYTNVTTQQELIKNSNTLPALPPALSCTTPNSNKPIENNIQYVYPKLSYSTHVSVASLRLPPQKLSTLSLPDTSLPLTPVVPAISSSTEIPEQVSLQCTQTDPSQSASLYPTSAPTLLSSALQDEQFQSIPKLQQLLEQEVLPPVYKSISPSASQFVSIPSNQLQTGSTETSSQFEMFQTEYQLPQSKSLQPASALTPSSQHALLQPVQPQFIPELQLLPEQEILPPVYNSISPSASQFVSLPSDQLQTGSTETSSQFEMLQTECQLLQSKPLQPASALTSSSLHALLQPVQPQSVPELQLLPEQEILPPVYNSISPSASQFVSLPPDQLQTGSTETSSQFEMLQTECQLPQSKPLQPASALTSSSLHALLQPVQPQSVPELQLLPEQEILPPDQLQTGSTETSSQFEMLQTECQLPQSKPLQPASALTPSSQHVLLQPVQPQSIPELQLLQEQEILPPVYNSTSHSASQFVSLPPDQLQTGSTETSSQFEMLQTECQLPQSKPLQPASALTSSSQHALLQPVQPHVQPSQNLQTQSAVAQAESSNNELLQNISTPEPGPSKSTSELKLKLSHRCDPKYIQQLTNCINTLKQKELLTAALGTIKPVLLSTVRLFCEHYGVVYPATSCFDCCADLSKLACPKCIFCIEFVRAIMLEMNRSNITPTDTLKWTNTPNNTMNLVLINNIATVLSHRMTLFSNDFATTSTHHQRWLTEIQQRLTNFLISQNETAHASIHHINFIKEILSSHIGVFPLYERLNLNIFGYSTPKNDCDTGLNESQNCITLQDILPATQATAIQAPNQSTVTASGSSEHNVVDLQRNTNTSKGGKQSSKKRKKVNKGKTGKRKTNK